MKPEIDKDPSLLPPIGSRQSVAKDDRITASLHGAVGVIEKHRIDRPDSSWGSNRSDRIIRVAAFLRFDEPQKGAGATMRGVWLFPSMMEASQ